MLKGLAQGCYHVLTENRRSDQTIFDFITSLKIDEPGELDLETALESDMAASRDMIAVIPTPDGALRVVGSPIKLSGHKADYRLPPLLGEHTEEILGKPRVIAAK